ncbi:hypothetical protein J056_000881 [Wallemia ichthyophaga EXF-994]|uniref:C3H1-type domain-containing protein n=1 Tax=Wallemia ichthyophaga (strain EXF-994 / CBS 113033) TaxID=1299270 RepID=R9ADU9_WALI9|nr:uncharacterized protein J056_000881 [Wallemia ichthyophaga EXF-994]EOR00343.1 hypothetical protein J056_000881 [Wallemia ichthyophaga EXF-994]
MSDDKTEFNQILETNPEFINWAKVSDALWHVTNGSGELKKEAMYHPPDQSESVSKYIERRLVERGWPNEIEQILVLIRDESNATVTATVHDNNENSSNPSKSNTPNHTGLTEEQEEYNIITAKVYDSIKQLPHNPVQIANTIINCIFNAVFEADSKIRILALEAANNDQLDIRTESEYIDVWSGNKKAIKLLSGWFKDACSTHKSDIEEWKPTQLPLLLFLTKINFETEKIKQEDFLSLVKVLCASPDPNVAEAARNLEHKWTQQVSPPLPQGRSSRSSSKRSIETANDESSKKVKVEGKPPATLFPSAKSTISKLPSFKKAPKVQEIPGVHTQAPAQEGKSSTRASPQQAPPSAAASRATPVNKQNPFADSLAMMSQEHQKKRPTFNDHPARPPPGQREQREQEKRAAESAADSAKKANSKSVRWMPERELVSVRWIESRAEQDDHHEHLGDAKQLEVDEGAMLKKHITSVDEDQPEEYDIQGQAGNQAQTYAQSQSLPHQTPPSTPQKRTKDIRQWFEPYICERNLDDQAELTSSEKEVQEQREATTIMATYLTEDQIPFTPAEPKRVLDSRNDDGKTTVMIKSDTADEAPPVAGGISAPLNSIPPTQFGSSFGSIPPTNSIQPEQQMMLHNILTGNTNAGGLPNFSAYDLPPKSKAFYQHGERERKGSGSYGGGYGGGYSGGYGGGYGTNYSANHSPDSSLNIGSNGSNNYYQKPKYECKFYRQGNCTKGSRCTFKHSA